MNGIGKRLTALVLTAAVSLSALSLSAAAQEDSASAASSGSYQGVYTYCPIVPGAGGGDAVDRYSYSDDYFRGSSYIHNPHLASMSMSVAQTSIASARSYGDSAFSPAHNICALLEDIGFGDVSVNADYLTKPTTDSIGVACGHKRVDDRGEDYTLLAVAIRSGGYGAEWVNNFTLGSEGDANGFDAASERALAYVRSYLAAAGLSGKLKVWAVGYSRGGAVVDLIAKKLIDDPAGSLGGGVSLSSDHLYAYTFGTPSAADDSLDHDDARYHCIFNHYSDCELAALMAPVGMGFGRYGVDYVINSAENRARMLELLAVCSPAAYATYTDGGSPADFSPRVLSFDNAQLNFYVDEDPYIPADAATYLRGLSAYMTTLSGGREGYANTFEGPITALIGYVAALPSAQRSAFLDSLMNYSDLMWMSVAVYCYFMKCRIEEQEAAAGEESLAAVAASAPEAVGFSLSDYFKMSMQANTYLKWDSAQIKAEAARYLGEALTAAMQSSGATAEQIEAILTPSNLDALTVLISHLLFGNIWQSGELAPKTMNNEQIRSAATLVGNITNLVTDHMSEVLISWVRVDDSYYDAYAPLTEAQAASYRRVYLRADGAAVRNASILDGAGDTVAVLAEGVLTDVADPWIGYTTTDDGGFLRIPSGDSYRVVVNGTSNSSLSAAVDEYDCREAKSRRAYDASTVMTAGDATLSLPAIGGSSLPSGAAYDLSTVSADAPLRGDTDGDGIICILDATCIQRRLVDLHVRRYIAGAADADGDGTVSILDATCIQRWIAGLPTSDRIGRPIGS